MSNPIDDRTYLNARQGDSCAADSWLGDDSYRPGLQSNLNKRQGSGCLSLPDAISFADPFGGSAAINQAYRAGDRQCASSSDAGFPGVLPMVRDVLRATPFFPFAPLPFLSNGLVADALFGRSDNYSKGASGGAGEEYWNARKYAPQSDYLSSKNHLKEAPGAGGENYWNAYKYAPQSDYMGTYNHVVASKRAGQSYVADAVSGGRNSLYDTPRGGSSIYDDRLALKGRYYNYGGYKDSSDKWT